MGHPLHRPNFESLQVHTYIDTNVHQRLTTTTLPISHMFSAFSFSLIFSVLQLLQLLLFFLISLKLEDDYYQLLLNPISVLHCLFNRYINLLTLCHHQCRHRQWLLVTLLNLNWDLHLSYKRYQTFLQNLI